MKALIFVLLLAAPLRAANAPYGILLLAHGGDPSWNGEVAALRDKVDAKVPTETSLGMADVDSLQAAVDRLEKRGVARIVAVPLFIQSRSEVLDQTRYALKLTDKPSAALKAAYERMASAHSGHHMHGHSMVFSTKQVTAQEPISISPALDDDALVGRILTERAKGLSKDAASESLVLVAHGPTDDDAMKAWKKSTGSLCGKLKGYKSCSFGLLRDDAPPKIRAAAVAELRKKVTAAKGKAIVLPVLIARGGIEKKIEKDLAGLTYAWDGKTLMPHDGFAAWVLERAASTIR